MGQQSPSLIHESPSTITAQLRLGGLTEMHANTQLQCWRSGRDRQCGFGLLRGRWRCLFRRLWRRIVEQRLKQGLVGLARW
jgi:hypothetical protein